MVERQLENGTYLCPQCHQKLIQRETELICPDHGSFFAYGPQLVVRSPRKDDDKGNVSLPWEKPSSAFA